MNILYSNAIRKASSIRLDLGLDLFQPINIYDVCAKLNVDVQFVDVNMEGLYINHGGQPKILISSQRPFARRVFTCGHELGHHVFNHGLKVDILTEGGCERELKSSDETLVDAFSSALLMPVGGIQNEFLKRNINMYLAAPKDYFLISSVFGVGYQTLINQCRFNRLINETKAMELSKYTPAKIFRSEFPAANGKSFFKFIDGKSDITLIDIEVSNYIFIPENFIVDEVYLKIELETDSGVLYKAVKSGISSINSKDGERNYFVRIQPESYVGFAEYRHLEN
jgi:Zn-dependent peptidase ImmA (M78 family)